MDPDPAEFLTGILFFHWLPRRPEDLIHPEQPAPTPIMLGCAFAIRRDYFFDLGAYDEQLMIWNGENYEVRKHQLFPDCFKHLQLFNIV